MRPHLRELKVRCDRCNQPGATVELIDSHLQVTGTFHQGCGLVALDGLRYDDAMAKAAVQEVR